MDQTNIKSLLISFLLILGLTLSFGATAQESLFESVGPPDTVNLPEHALAGQNVRVNRRALQFTSLSIELFGESFVAERVSIDRKTAGQVVWVGHLLGNSADAVILTVRGNVVSGFIQNGADMYRIGHSTAQGSRLYYLDLQVLPPDDAGELPNGGGEFVSPDSEVAADNTVQDLLVVYNQSACDAAGGCAQLEGDIVTAVADINSAYAASGITITMNLAGMHQTVYDDSTVSSSQALSDLKNNGDGKMDEVHGVRDALFADVVSMIYNGPGCGIGYLTSSASTAFNVTRESCLVGNRTMAHEIGHNQGAHHDRVTVGGGTTGAYNYGFRRCSDGSVDDFGSPYFRTVLSYSCSSATRVGRFSNPNVNYLGVPQGVDPDVDPDKGAWNARRLNERAATVAAFRDSPTGTVPNAPSGLAASVTGPDSINISWSDNSPDETSFMLQSTLDDQDDNSWSTIATLGANTTSHSDTGLNPNTEYFYRVKASNSVGDSAWSNVDSGTTDPLPASVEDFANGDVLVKGTVSGSYTATQVDGGAVQTITESHSGGPKRSRKQSYEHGWTVDVFGGAGGVTVFVDAWVSGSEGANFFYSLDGGASRNLMFTVNNNSSNGGQTFALPAGASGAVRIYVEDATQTNGEAVDSVSVDYIVITSYTDAGDPPLAPSSMVVTDTTSSSVSLQFMDNSEDEFGFELWRATSNPGIDCFAGDVIDSLSASAGTGLVSASDNSVAPNTSYWYWAVAFNGAGNDGTCSNAAFTTTPVGSSISLSVNGYKVKGSKTVDLIWSGAVGGTVDIYRDGSLLTNTSNDGAYTDNTGQKGGGTLTYEVCETGSTTSCSDPQNAAF